MTSADDWPPLTTDESDETRRLKWGWNHLTGEATVWEVSGPGDGFPTHNDQLRLTWGREPSIADGDSVGTAELCPPLVEVYAYYRAEVPDAVMDCFRELLPGLRVVVR